MTKKELKKLDAELRIERKRRHAELREELSALVKSGDLREESRDWLGVRLLEIQDDLRRYGAFGKLSDLDQAERHLDELLDAIVDD
jgi:hypothetical protein